MRKNNQYYLRKTHRYLGVFLGIQFLLWTLGGFYFSWNDIDVIHGDDLVSRESQLNLDTLLISPGSIQKNLTSDEQLTDLTMVEILAIPYYLVSTENKITKTTSLTLFNAYTGYKREPLTKEEATQIANDHFMPNAGINSVELLTSEDISNHHEYRGGPLPVWAVSFDHPSQSILYIPANTGQLHRIRFNKWRTFDFLWMLHTMDYKSRDDFGNILLKTFSILGIITILSGFILFIISSPRLRSRRKKS